jgi:hypothetical protein
MKILQTLIGVFALAGIAAAAGAVDPASLRPDILRDGQPPPVGRGRL